MCTGHWRLGPVARTVCAVSDKMLTLLGGAVLAIGLGALAVVGATRLLLACAAAVAFVPVIDRMAGV